MKTNLWLAAAGLILTAGCQCLTPSRQSQPVQAEIQSTSQEWDRLYNSGNAVKLASLYAEDAISMPPHGPTLTGRKALQADFEGFFAANVARHETTIDKILIEGDLAIEVARYRLTCKPRAGGTEVVETGRHMETRRKINGQWKIILEIWNSDSPPPK